VIRTLATATLTAALALSCAPTADVVPPAPALRQADGRWTVAAARDWHAARPWIVGFNYVPATAINPLEMWQAETFDPATIDKELGWATAIGFNSLRVFLHDLLWTAEPEAYAERIETFLTIADRHGFSTMLVLFDNVWGPEPTLGPQPDPIAGVHNSGWTQSPAQADTITFPDAVSVQTRLEAYVRGVIRRFGRDRRVLAWDLVNEPGNSGLGDLAAPLVEASFAWARDESPDQPLTAGVWLGHTTWALSRRQIELSDVVSFHAYQPARSTQSLIEDLAELAGGRPLLCTEYMARSLGSTFEGIMPLLATANIGAFHWGLVSGRSQTIYSWASREGDPEPAVWFHDILYPDGTPWDAEEVDFIRTVIADSHGG
jgi:hypothetical protein